MASVHGRGRAFRPTLAEGSLEPRLLLAHRAKVAATHVAQKTPGQIQYFVANGGRTARIVDTDGEQYNVILTNATSSALGNITGINGSPGTIRAYPMPGGRVGLIVDGTGPNTELTINPFGPIIANRGNAHHFAVGESFQDHLLHVGSLVVTSGQIGSILGFRTADLSGPLIVNTTGTVDRIAFEALLPGASIQVGHNGFNHGVLGQGDLNTLDVLKGVTLTAGPGIAVGRDLNAFNVGGGVTLLNGASLLVGRDIGLTAQPAKGSGLAGRGAFIQGDLIIGPGSQVNVGRSLDAPFIVQGYAGPDTLARFRVGPGSFQKGPIVFQGSPGTA
jgi:hypothetical protein